MAQIVAVLSNDKPIFTQPYRPEGHGKIEAFNRYCRAAFVDEVQASSITDLDGLNLAFSAWRELKYNRRPHSEIGSSPWDRWRTGAGAIAVIDERELTEAFLFRASRTTDKSGVLKLFGHRYQTGPGLARKRVEVRYDPEDLAELEVWHGDTFQERVKPLTVGPTRRPKVVDTVEPTEEPLVDWLGELTKRHEPLPTVDAVAQARKERAQQDCAMVELVQRHVDERVFDEAVVQAFLDRYGPFEAAAVAETLALIVELGGADQHLQSIFEALLASLGRS